MCRLAQAYGGAPVAARPVAEVIVQVGQLDGPREVPRRAVGARDPLHVLLVGLGVSAGQEPQGRELDRREAAPEELGRLRGRALEDVVQEGDRARLRRHRGGHPLDVIDERGSEPGALPEVAVAGDATRRLVLHGGSIAPDSPRRILRLG